MAAPRPAPNPAAFPPAPSNVAVQATTTSPKDKNVTFYVILVKWGNKVWTVNRRFSEFEALMDKLSADLQKLPALPKKAFWGSTDPELVAKRRVELDAWLNVVVKEPYVLNNPLFHSFLTLADNVGALLTNRHLPKEITHLEDTQFGVNALAYDDDNTVMFTACGDASQLSRWDSKLHNMQMPWSSAKKGSTHGTMVPIGSLSCWKEAQSIYKLACTLFFESEVTCVAWDPARRYVFIGLDSGKLVVYFINEAFAEFNVVKTIANAHTDRVVALAYDKQKDVLLTASRDKRICVYNVKNFEPIGSIDTGKAWLSCMAVDVANARVFVGNYAQQILIYEYSTHQNPMLAHTLVGHTGSLRCIAFLPNERKLFSSGFDAMSGIWNITPPNEVTKSHSINWLSGGPAQKIKSIAYYAGAAQVITGLESGGICIWQSADGGRLLHVLPGHTDAVVHLEFVEHKRMLISGSRDSRVKLWQFPAPDDGSGKTDIQPFTAAAAATKSTATVTTATASAAATFADAKDKKQAPPLPPLPHKAAAPTAEAEIAMTPASTSDVSTALARPALPRSDPNAILSELDG